MANSKLCVECGTLLPGYWPKGLCTRCALDGALNMSHAESQTLQSQTQDDRPSGNAAALADDAPPPSAFGDYELIEELARGGMGVVYRARQLSLNRIVAVKMILAGPMAGKGFIKRFRAEASAAAMLQHPNIVAIHDVGVHEGRHYFSMDYVEGQNLGQLVGQQPLPPGSAARYVRIIAEAIDYAHKRGILHRDLKPSNVLVETATDQPRITDFGLARRLDGDASLTLSGQMLGSPSFMPPEQAGAKRGQINRASDVYALGGILYYLLTARAPFQAESLEQVLAQVLHAEPIPPRLLNASLPRDLETITLKCLEKEPSRRYQTASELAEELDCFLRHEPIRARPITRPEKLWRWCRRKPALASALGFGVAALLAGLVTTSWQWRRAERQGATARHLLYVANMNLVQAAWEQNHASQARQILKDTEADPGRGFEWYYWQKRLHPGGIALRGHAAPILAVAYSPPGDYIATGGADNSVKVWNARNGHLLFTLRGHQQAVCSVAWSSDGQWIVTGSFDHTARVWNATNGLQVHALVGHKAAILAVAYSPDGRQIVTGSRDQTAIVWNATTGGSLFSLQGHKGVIWSVAFSTDSQRIVTGSWDCTAVVWSAADGANQFTFTGHRDPVLAVAFSPDGHRIVSGSLDQTARIWDATSGLELNVLRGHTAPVFSVAFSRDGQRIATAGEDQTARVWDGNGGNDLLAVKRHGSSISSVDFSPDGLRIVTGGGSIGFSPDGADQIYPGNGDGIARIWDISEDEEPLTLRGHTDAVYCAFFSPDGKRLVTTSSDRTARIRTAATGEELIVLNGHTHLIRAAAFSPDGRRIVTGSADGTCKVWDAATGEMLLTFPEHDRWVMSVTFSPDGRTIASAGQDGRARLWDATTGKEYLNLKGGHWVWSVAFSPDGKRILTGNEDPDNTAKVWDAITGRELLALRGHRGWVICAAFSPDGRRIVTASGDRTGRVWDADTGRELVSLDGHSDLVMSARFSPDGRRIVTGSRDQTARVWDAASGKELLALRGHLGWVISTVFSPDGSSIATASLDRTARIWTAASAEEVAEWGKEEQASAREREREALAAEAWISAQRAGMPGGLKRWLVLLPIPYEGKSGADALGAEQVPHESQLRPRPGDSVKVGRSNLVWREIQSEDYLFDFNQVAGRPSEYCVAYAVCYLQCPTARTNLVLKVGSDDHAKIILNGREIYQFTNALGLEPDRETIPGIELNAGSNVLIFKVVNEGGDWGGSIRITDAAGNAVEGLRLTPSPP